jgi:hypothetical protein
MSLCKPAMHIVVTLPTTTKESDVKAIEAACEAVQAVYEKQKYNEERFGYGGYTGYHFTLDVEFKSEASLPPSGSVEQNAERSDS